MKYDIILAGVGGQGILSIAAILGYGAVEAGLYVKQSEVHGMSQRGGAVQSHVRLSDKPIYSDLIREGDADMILSMEPMESLRYLPFLSPQGMLITNTAPFINIPDYPDIHALMAEFKNLHNTLLVDADSLARETGNPKGMNMVIAGAAAYLIKDIPFHHFEDGVTFLFGRKGMEIVEANMKALRAGKDFAGEKLK